MRFSPNITLPNTVSHGNSAEFMKSQTELALKIASAHRELTAWILANPEQAQKLAQAELRAETRTDFPEPLLRKCWDRITLTSDISKEALRQSVADAQAAGFLRDVPDIAPLIVAP